MNIFGYKAAFALSSGTIGAAMSASISGFRSMALSYGTVAHPTPLAFHNPAHTLACQIVARLWTGWQPGNDDDSSSVSLYNINIPMIQGLLESDSLPVYWTTLWRNSYGRLFSCIQQTSSSHGKETKAIVTGSPAAGPDSDVLVQQLHETESSTITSSLVFKFAPEFKGIINPDPIDLPEGCDAWALAKGAVSVSPLIACFAEGRIEFDPGIKTRDRQWKL